MTSTRSYVVTPPFHQKCISDVFHVLLLDILNLAGNQPLLVTYGGQDIPEDARFDSYDIHDDAQLSVQLGPPRPPERVTKIVVVGSQGGAGTYVHCPEPFNEETQLNDCYFNACLDDVIHDAG